MKITKSSQHKQKNNFEIEKKTLRQGQYTPVNYPSANIYSKFVCIMQKGYPTMHDHFHFFKMKNFGRIENIDK